jgi:hypothetical protein
MYLHFDKVGVSVEAEMALLMTQGIMSGYKFRNLSTSFFSKRFFIIKHHAKIFDGESNQRVVFLGGPSSLTEPHSVGGRSDTVI